MKKYITLILLILSAPNLIYSDAIRGEVKSFKELEKKVNKAQDLTTTLIVMDDDDTLTMMECDKSKSDKHCQYLGEPAWYAWQDKLLKEYTKKGKDHVYRIASNEQELLDISTLLFSLNNMPYTDKHIPKVLSKLSKKGVKLLVETARGSDTISATTAQFTKLKAGKNTFMDLIEQNSLKFGQNGIASLASPFTPCGMDKARKISYQKGAMYLAGQNKGVMLKCILSKYKSSKITEIFFIDDTLANVKDMYKAFKDDPNYKVHALHYTAFNKHKDALTKGDKKEFFQKQTYDRWITIKNMMGATLLDPNLK